MAAEPDPGPEPEYASQFAKPLLVRAGTCERAGEGGTTGVIQNVQGAEKVLSAFCRDQSSSEEQADRTILPRGISPSGGKGLQVDPVGDEMNAGRRSAPAKPFEIGPVGTDHVMIRPERRMRPSGREKTGNAGEQAVRRLPGGKTCRVVMDDRETTWSAVTPEGQDERRRKGRPVFPDGVEPLCAQKIADGSHEHQARPGQDNVRRRFEPLQHEVR
ncbi:MAG: hypothetical protein BWY66_00196 [bacterium ADurb.Bin374]|nr:MAG: hypothetical protein BWY66_00196 [bacterium ADurb.Bin374]